MSHLFNYLFGIHLHSSLDFSCSYLIELRGLFYSQYENKNLKKFKNLKIK